MNRRSLLATLLLVPAIKKLLPKKPLTITLYDGPGLDLEGPPQGESFDLKMIDDMVEKAKEMSPRIKPVTIDGKEYYVFWL